MSRIVTIYRHALRLYPREFRDRFADEMADVFAQSVESAANQPTLVGLIVREAVHLPVSAAAEHWSARRMRLIYQGDTLMLVNTERLHRRIAVILAVIACAYLLCVAAPFFYYGLHLERWELVVGGFFDPKGYWPYEHGDLIYGLATLSVVLMPVIGAVMSVRLALATLVRWPMMDSRRRIIGGALLALAVALVVFPFTPLGRTLFVWLLD